MAGVIQSALAVKYKLYSHDGRSPGVTVTAIV
jgi:hypothetical protein